MKNAYLKSVVGVIIIVGIIAAILVFRGSSDGSPSGKVGTSIGDIALPRLLLLSQEYT